MRNGHVSRRGRGTVTCPGEVEERWVELYTKVQREGLKCFHQVPPPELYEELSRVQER